jgi:hypothetical protein
MIYGQFPDDREQLAESSIAVMVNGMSLFNYQGDIEILDLWSECQTPNDLTASTLQYSVTPTGLSVTTISAASASLASAAAGAMVALDGTTLAAAANLYATGVGLGQAARGINLIGGGAINAVIGVGSTTGTWKHYIRWRPLSNGASVTGV